MSAVVCAILWRMEFALPLAVERLKTTPAVLEALLSGASREWVEGSEGPGTWSSYQVLGHLVHIEGCDWLDRTKVILEHGVDRPFEPVDREAGFERFRGWRVDSLLARFRELRRMNLAELVQRVDERALDRRGVHPDFGEVTLAQLLATWVVHDLNHTGQITKAMSKQYRDAVGPWRAYLPILDAP